MADIKYPKGWDEAKFNAFIRNGLRNLSLKFPVKHEVLKRARVKRGWYRCASCDEVVPVSVPSEPNKNGKKKRIRNVDVDHIDPVINPEKGFENWDTYIERLFLCGEDGMQVLCKKCHDIKTKKERAIAKDRKSQQKIIRDTPAPY